MRRGEITEEALTKANLTKEEIKVARLIYGLPSAGGDHSSTNNWYSENLSPKRRSELIVSVQKKLHESSIERAGD
jgi:hypothetical protein